MTGRLDGKPAAIQREIDRIDAGGDAWNEDDEVVEIEFKRPLDKVVPVRLASEHWYRLYHEAHELGVGPTTLARMWILEKLRTLPAAAAAPGVTASTSQRRAPGPNSPAKRRQADREVAASKKPAPKPTRGTAAARSRPVLATDHTTRATKPRHRGR